MGRELEQGEEPGEETPGAGEGERLPDDIPRISVPEPRLPPEPESPEPAAEPAPAEPAGERRRRKWPWVLLAAVVTLFLITWIPVLALRWANPPTTAFMAETAASLPHGEGLERGAWVPYGKISPAMRLAVVASEDQTFPTNHGFDFRAIHKAIEHNERGGTVHGASTITQQTAKNLFLWPARSYFRKAVGAYFTVLIDFTWPKRRVLAVYLNIVQFGPRTFGIEAAAEHYFGKHASQLSAPEAALLAATLPDPQRLDPARPSAYLLERQAWILEQMRHLGSGYLRGL